MKILLLADGLEGGSLSEPGMWLGDLARRWVARGHRVHAVVMQATEPWQEPEDLPEARVWRPAADRLVEAIEESLEDDPDVVHVASSGPFAPRLVDALGRHPVLLDVHDYWPICPVGDLLRRPFMEPCDRQYPYLGCGACAGLSRVQVMEEKLRLAGLARVVLAHSRFSATRLTRGLRRPVEVLGHGVDLARFRPDPIPPAASDLSALYETRDRPRAILLGPPTHARGGSRIIDLLVALESRTPGVELVVAGRDPANPDWHQMAFAECKEMGLEGRVHTIPAVAADDLPALYASCQLAIAPLLGFDPGGLFARQAMAAGLPIVARPLGALAEMIRDGETGIVVATPQIAPFASAMAALFGNHATRARLGGNARLAALESHDLERTVFELERLHQGLRSRPAPRAAA